MNRDQLSILVVEDEQNLAEMYATWLATEFDVRTAYTAEEALETISHQTDVVFLDRRLPEASGSEVLEGFENEHYDCQVAMVTAVDPDFDIIDMGFDGYLVKPVTDDDLFDMIDTLERRLEFEGLVKEYADLEVKRSILKAEKNARELERSEKYATLIEQLESVKSDIGDLKDQFSQEDLQVLAGSHNF